MEIVVSVWETFSIEVSFKIVYKIVSLYNESKLGKISLYIRVATFIHYIFILTWVYIWYYSKFRNFNNCDMSNEKIRIVIFICNFISTNLRIFLSENGIEGKHLRCRHSGSTIFCRWRLPGRWIHQSDLLLPLVRIEETSSVTGRNS